jgi:hypothetical protein
MNTCVLLEKLIDIERSLGVETTISVHKKVIEAQECLLAIQKEMAESSRCSDNDSSGTNYQKQHSPVRRRMHA